MSTSTVDEQERKREYKRRYRAENRDAINASGREYYWKNRDKLRAAQNLRKRERGKDKELSKAEFKRRYWRIKSDPVKYAAMLEKKRIWKRERNAKKKALRLAEKAKNFVPKVPKVKIPKTPKVKVPKVKIPKLPKEKKQNRQKISPPHPSVIVDFSFALLDMIDASFAKRGVPRTIGVVDLLGCTVKQLRRMIAIQFDGTMNWENYSVAWKLGYRVDCKDVRSLNRGENFCPVPTIRP